jgi:hypothetical protein
MALGTTLLVYLHVNCMLSEEKPYPYRGREVKFPGVHAQQTSWAGMPIQQAGVKEGAFIREIKEGISRFAARGGMPLYEPRTSLEVASEFGFGVFCTSSVRGFVQASYRTRTSPEATPELVRDEIGGWDRGERLVQPPRYFSGESYSQNKA